MFLSQEELSAVKETYELKVDELSNQLQEQIKAENGLRVEFESLQTEVTRLTETEDVLQGKVANRERKISHLEDKMADLQDSRSKKVRGVSLSLIYERTLCSFRSLLPLAFLYTQSLAGVRNIWSLARHSPRGLDPNTVVTLGTQPVGCYTEVVCLYSGTCI